MDLYERLSENLSLWILHDRKNYDSVKQILIDNGNTLRSEKMLIEYLQSIDEVCKEVGSIGIDYVVNKKFMEELIDTMEIEIDKEV